MFFSKKKEKIYIIGQEIPLRQNDGYRFLDKKTASALKTGRKRMMLLAYFFLFAFIVVGARLFQQTILNHAQSAYEVQNKQAFFPIARADILDRNGRLLATGVPVSNLQLEGPISVPAETLANQLAQIFPNTSANYFLGKIKRHKSITTLRRNLTPAEKMAVNRLGYPQLNFTDAERRFYPQGHLFAHLIGYTNVDNEGIAGMELALNKTLLNASAPVYLSVDLRVQAKVYQILAEGMKDFKAESAGAIVMDVKTGEILAFVSLPDFDLNNIQVAPSQLPPNILSASTYELGSVMKIINASMGLELGAVKPNDFFDTTPFKIGRRMVNEYHPEGRPLNVPEVLIYSSNVGSAKIALKVGADAQKKYMERLNLLSPLKCELPEKASPQKPFQWGEIETATIGYGYGLALSPLHMISAFSALMNGGIYHQPTFLKQNQKQDVEWRVVSEKTSRQMRHMMRAVADIGSGKKANINGYLVGGKTGTAQIIENGKYAKGKTRTSFIGAFPMDDPQLAVYVFYIHPRAKEGDWGFYDAGWNACPTAGKIIKQIAPLLGIEKKEELAKPDYIEVAYEQQKLKKKK